jgi:hypothetical protein
MKTKFFLCNKADVAHGWPAGVQQALIVTVAADGKTEILRRQPTTRLHNDVQMPEGSHGKQFIIKAAFLKHIDDEPEFGPEPTFSMPLSTEDLAGRITKNSKRNCAKSNATSWKSNACRQSPTANGRNKNICST